MTEFLTENTSLPPYMVFPRFLLVSFRDIVRDRIVSRLRDVYGKKFEYERLNDASDYIDGCIQEDPYLFRERARQKAWEQDRRDHQSRKPQKKHRDFEL